MSRVTSSSAQSTNPSIGSTGSPAPTSATEIGAVTPLGDLSSLLVDNNGALVVNASGSFGVQDVVVSYNEVSSVAVGIETIINIFTAPLGFTSYLLNILCAGQNIGQFNIYVNGVLFDRQYLSYTAFNALFDYKTNSGSVPGYVVPAGVVVTVTAINAGNSSCLYNARMMILEVN